MFSRFTRVIGTAAACGFTITSIFMPVATRADEQDPGVARISLLSGGVDVQRADSGQTVSAVVNAPLNAGDYLTTQHDARSELQLDGLTSLRVAPDTQLRFTTLDANSNALQLAQGTVELRLFRGNDANPEVDTPNASIVPTQSGAYRVSVGNDGNAVVTVRSGAATISTQNASQTFTAGTSVAIDGDARSAQFDSIQTLAYDDFDAYNDDRDRYESNAPSYAHVDDRFVGASDLDQYGSWQNVDGYGEVWHPRYASGWAPYQDGNWTWEPYYGWTWVSAEPWGWAPYHYGRWFYAANNGGWCWTPATRYVQPVYQPAQVAFFSFGFGDGGGISIGFGNVGWVPLGPTDTFRPWWGRGYGAGYGGNGTVVNNITNITNITNVTNIYNYHNINAPGGIVAVRSANFQNGDFRQRLHPTPAALRLANISTVHGVLPLVPTTHNLAFKTNESVAQHTALSPHFDRFKPVAAVAAPHTFAEQRAAVSAVAQKAYPTEAKSFARQAPAAATALTVPSAPKSATPEGAPRVRIGDTVRQTVRQPDAVRVAPAATTVRATQPDTTTAATQRAPQNDRIQSQAKPASPWDRFSKQQSVGGATPSVTNVRNGTAERTVTDAPETVRPSYAQPDAATSRPATNRPATNPARAAAPAAVPEVRTVDPQHSTASPWDRFGSTARTPQPPASTSQTTPNRASDATPEIYRASRPSPTLSTGRAVGNTPHTEQSGNAVAPVTTRVAPPVTERAAPPPANSYQRAVDHATPVDPIVRTAPVERPAPVVRSVPVERAAPVVRSVPVERAAPVVRSAPVERAAPVVRSAPVERAAPVVRSAPVERAAPAANSAPAPHAAAADVRSDAHREHR